MKKHLKKEELKGKQHELDADGNGKITGKDFKILKAKKGHKFADWVEAKESQLDEIWSLNPFHWGKSKNQIAGERQAARAMADEKKNKVAQYTQGAEQLRMGRDISSQVRTGFGGAIEEVSQMLGQVKEEKLKIQQGLSDSYANLQATLAKVNEMIRKVQSDAGLKINEQDKLKLDGIIETLKVNFGENMRASFDFVMKEMMPDMFEGANDLMKTLDLIKQAMAGQISQSAIDIKRRLAPKVPKWKAGKEDTLAGTMGAETNPADSAAAARAYRSDMRSRM